MRLSNLEPDPPPSLAAVEQVRREVSSGNWPPLIPHGPSWPAELGPEPMERAAPPAGESNEDYPRVFNPDEQLVRYRGGASIPFPPPPGAGTSDGSADYAHDYRALQNSGAAREAMARHAEETCTCIGCVTRRKHETPAARALRLEGATPNVAAQKGLTVAELRELLRPPGGWKDQPVWVYVSYLALFIACLALGGVIGLSLVATF